MAAAFFSVGPNRARPSGTAPKRQAAGAARVFFGAAPVDAVDLKGATTWLLEALQQRHSAAAWTPLQIMGPNAFLVSLAAKNSAFAEALRRAALCLPDGMSVVWGARLLGQRIPERVPGGEFMEHMCALCAAHGLSVYFLGGLPGAAEGAAAALQQRYPGLVVAGTDCPPWHFEQDEQLNEAVRARIAAAKPDLLCVALGAPKQEIWMLDECGSLPIGAVLSVGAALDTQAGLRKRAPSWTHALGVEWLYRLALEPRRLWKRYFFGNLAFAAITARQWGQLRKERALGELLRARDPEHRSAPQAPPAERESLLPDEPARPAEVVLPADAGLH